MSAVEFYCLFCAEKMRVASDAAGGVSECPACLREVPVPGFPAGGGLAGCLPAFPAEILSLDVTFLCLDCRGRLVIDGRWEGQAVDCPVCNATLTVPLWSGKRPSVRGTSAAATVLSSAEIDFLNRRYAERM